MYVVIVGKHPLHDSGDTHSGYIAKLQSPQWNCPGHFSTLARSLFFRLVKVNPLERYTAKEALAHPWITRQPGEVPLSFTENVAFERSKAFLMQVRPLAIALGIRKLLLFGLYQQQISAP
jgi:serine/threonine protein kinase